MLLGLNRILLSSSLVVMVFASACTRKAETDLSLKLTVPTSSSFSSLTFPDAKLMTVIVNVRIPGKNLYVKEIEFHDNGGGPQYGAPITIEVPNVPSGSNALVQYLGVFESTTGQMIFTYGDTTVNITGAQTTANLTATQFGSSTKEGRVAGRFITGGTSPSSMTGPTGTMIGYIMPPGGKPRMAVKKSPIINGWFNVFFLEGAAALMTYEMMDGTPIFENKNLAFFNTSNSNHKKIVMNKPISYRKNHDDGTMQAEGEVDYVLGFFAKDATVVSTLSSAWSTLSICYPTTSQSIPNVFTTANATAQMLYTPTNSPGSDITKNSTASSGSSGVALSSLFVTACDPTSPSILRFMPHLLSSGDSDSSFGLRPPFRLMNEFQEYGGYLTSKFNGTNAIDLAWSYLPGIITADISGATIYGKYYPTGNMGGGNSGGDSKNCYEKAMSENMEVVTTMSGTTTGYTATGTVLGTAIAANTYYKYEFLVCPYRDIAGSAREYYKEIRTNCIGGSCGSANHYGWGTENDTISTSVVYDANRIARVTGSAVASGSGHLYTTLTLAAPAAGIAESDEVMLRVVSASGSDCGANISPNQYEFARALTSASGTTLVIPRGTFADNLNQTYLTATPMSANYCYVQVAKVLHLMNLTFNAGGSLFTDPFGNFTEAGGVLPLRVAGKLQFNDSGNSINTNATGFSNVATGNGHGSTPGTGGTAGGGGGPLYGAGGGAGAGGSGGMGNKSGGASGGTISGGGGGMFQIAMGAAGGGTASALGGTGGGLIFIAARTIENAAPNGSVEIVTNGDPGSSVTDQAGGGGGGGSVVIVNEKLLAGTYPIIIQARGGAGVMNGNASSGGGGGGSITVTSCSTTVLPSTVFDLSSNPTMGGTAGGGGVAQNGQPGVSLLMDASNSSHCH